ncbi:hypothetical protein Scep_010807 [Stephania cephalantha]|uniref:Uncharacterized protein n=1 Tax=Stephania cephalantha TaxID=152367 RepID=A0AAP0JVS5_9MAGN
MIPRKAKCKAFPCNVVEIPVSVTEKGCIFRRNGVPNIISCFNPLIIIKDNGIQIP